MLPYDEHKRLSILLLIPTEKKELAGIFTRLQKVTIKKIMNELNGENAEKNKNGIAIPMIKMVSTVNLKSVIEQMGIEKNPFENEEESYEIFQKTEFELKQDEQEFFGMIKTADFISAPFAFLIIEQHTNTVLAAGQVQDPLKN